jgi:hypothetical protein
VSERKPIGFDAFCGAGGCTRGYQLAGFEIWGCDVKPQPRYVGERFFQVDALELLADPEFMAQFSFVSASPPCQHYANVTRWQGNQDEHPDLIAPTRELLEATGLPWVMENVRTDELRADFMLCGTMFGRPFRRHRHFETNWSGLVMSLGCQHRSSDYSFDHGAKQPESVYRDAIGCEWMTVLESREAIPPIYTSHIGARLLSHIESVAAVA